MLYLHPAGNAACSPLIGNYHLTWMIGAPVEDTISVMHLITHGIPARYPDIKIINSHLVSGLAYLNPLLGFVQLSGGPGTVARHLPAAQRADDGVSMPTTSA